jgi:uncharacterized cupredoxin-like copper-binding protein
VTSVDEAEPTRDLDPPAAEPAVTKIPYAAVTAGWVNLFAPLVLLSIVLSLVAIVMAARGYERTVIEGGGGGGAPTGAAAAELGVDLGEWFFTFDADAITADQDVPISMTNEGNVEHNLAVLRPGADPSNESLIRDDMIIARFGDVAPGDTLEGSLNLGQGDYLFVCLLTGHYDAGMKATLSVVST